MKILSVADRALLYLYNLTGAEEGWGIYTSLGTKEEYRIERHDNMEVFNDDRAAVRHIKKNHPEVIDWMMRNADQDEIDFINKVPDEYAIVYINKATGAQTTKPYDDDENGALLPVAIFNCYKKRNSLEVVTL